MSIYIEPLIVQNLLITYLSALSAYRFLRLNKDSVRLFIASAAGCAFSLFYPFIRLTAINILLRLLSLVIISFTLFYGKCKVICGGAAYFLTSLTFGGAVFFITLMRYGSFYDAIDKPIISNPFIITGGALAVFMAVKLLSPRLFRTRDIIKNVYGYSFEYGGRTYNGSGYLDTGNLLYDFSNGLPVVIVSIRAIIPYLSSRELAYIACGNVQKAFKGARKIACGTLGGKSYVWGITPEKFTVYYDNGKNIIYDVTVGLSFSPVKAPENCDAVLPGAITEVLV